MRLAVFGDIHANLEAFEAMIADAKAHSCSKFACTGDVVGYNANPNECVDALRSMDCPVVRGNHDHDASGDHLLKGLHPKAHRALEWTREVLTESSRDWLTQLPYVLRPEGYTLVHATLNHPEAWGYVLDPTHAAANFKHQDDTVCFHGHTHLPVIYDSGEFDIRSSSKFARVQPNHRYLCNVGSVGKPRERDQRAAYAIYDDEQQTLAIQKVDYDNEAAWRKSREAGLIK